MLNADSEYERSRSLTDIPGLEKLRGRKSLRDLKEKLCSSSNDTIEWRKEVSNKIMTEVCDKLGIVKIPIMVVDAPQNHSVGLDGKLRRKTLGQCTLGKSIKIWNKTAIRKKTVSGKQFFETLTHEINHHIDVAKLGFERSLHTAGFYMRQKKLIEAFS